MFPEGAPTDTVSIPTNYLSQVSRSLGCRAEEPDSGRRGLQQRIRFQESDAAATAVPAPEVIVARETQCKMHNILVVDSEPNVQEIFFPRQARCGHLNGPVRP